MAAALFVHALDEQAKTFYLAHSFIESPIEPMTLMLSLAQASAWMLPGGWEKETGKVDQSTENIVPA